MRMIVKNIGDFFFTLIQCSDQADFYLFPSRWYELVMKIAIKKCIKISTTITCADEANLKKIQHSGEKVDC